MVWYNVVHGGVDSQWCSVLWYRVVRGVHGGVDSQRYSVVYGGCGTECSVVQWYRVL